MMWMTRNNRLDSKGAIPQTTAVCTDASDIDKAYPKRADLAGSGVSMLLQR